MRYNIPIVENSEFSHGTNIVFGEIKKLFTPFIQYVVTRGLEGETRYPLLFLVKAAQEGLHVDIRNGGESSNEYYLLCNFEEMVQKGSFLLDELSKKIDKDVFIGGRFVHLAKFFLKLEALIERHNKSAISYAYTIDCIIDSFTENSAKTQRAAKLPVSLSSLMVQIFDHKNGDVIYNPFSGYCTHALVCKNENVSFICQEIDADVKLEAMIRASAYQANVKFGSLNDSVHTWLYDGYQSIVSDCPLGTMMDANVLGYGRTRNLEEFLTMSFQWNSSAQDAVFLVSDGYLNLPIFEESRKQLVENKLIHSIISLPSNLLSSTGMNLYLLCLSKVNRNDDGVLMVSCEDCYTRNGRLNILQTNKVLDRVHNTAIHDFKRIAPFEEIRKYDYCMVPSYFMEETFKTNPGQVLIPLEDLCIKVRGTSLDPKVDAPIGIIPKLCSDIADLFFNTTEERKKIPYVYRRFEGKLLLTDPQFCCFYIVKEGETVYTTPGMNAYKVNESICIPEYLAYVLKHISKSLKRGSVIGRANLKFVPIYPELDRQKTILDRICSERAEVLQAKLLDLDIVRDGTSELVHNLGVCLTQISSSIKFISGRAEDYKDEELMSTSQSLKDNIQFALRQINANGVDFNSHVFHLKKVCLNSFIREYIQAWRNYGVKSFELNDLTTSISDKTIVELDDEAMKTVFDAILNNAHQHGFKKHYEATHFVDIEVSAVNYNDGKSAESEEFIMISFSNNGIPFPDDFSLTDFVTRGKTGPNIHQAGIGGDHICKIMHKHDGKVSLDNTGAYVKINLLIPSYLYDDTAIYNDYDRESI